jgi:hypothetical protein
MSQASSRLVISVIFQHANNYDAMPVGYYALRDGLLGIRIGKMKT